MLSGAKVHEVQLPLAWHFIERVRATAGELLAGQSAELVEAGTMAASELAENVVKYGISLDGEESGKLSFSFDGGALTIRSENGASEEQGDRVVALVKAVQGATDIGALYLSRLSEMSVIPNEAPTELGLLRIAFEGGFKLSCTFEDRRLIIEASRAAS